MKTPKTLCGFFLPIFTILEIKIFKYLSYNNNDNPHIFVKIYLYFKTKINYLKNHCFVFMRVSLISGWILLSASAFTPLQYIALVEIY